MYVVCLYILLYFDTSKRYYSAVALAVSIMLHLATVYTLNRGPDGWKRYLQRKLVDSLSSLYFVMKRTKTKQKDRQPVSRKERNGSGSSSSSVGWIASTKNVRTVRSEIDDVVANRERSTFMSKRFSAIEPDRTQFQGVFGACASCLVVDRHRHQASPPTARLRAFFAVISRSRFDLAQSRVDHFLIPIEPSPWYVS